ncbi:TonB family protein [Acinetobacter baumannii]
MARWRNEHGVVSIAFTSDPRGVPSECWIAESSGFADLDAGTCEALLKHGKFHPATDDDGRPKTGRLTLKVRW